MSSMSLEPRPHRGTTTASAVVRCPQCGGRLSRIARQPLDRLVSLVAPRRRYRCRTLGCGWTGALRRS